MAGRDLLEVAQIEVGERAKRTADYGTEAGPTLGRYATRTRPGSWTLSIRLSDHLPSYQCPEQEIIRE